VQPRRERRGGRSLTGRRMPPLASRGVYPHGAGPWDKPHGSLPGAFQTSRARTEGVGDESCNVAGAWAILASYPVGATAQDKPNEIAPAPKGFDVRATAFREARSRPWNTSPKVSAPVAR
jgi:hypothetical protein